MQLNRNESPDEDAARPLSLLRFTLPVKLKPSVPTQSKAFGERLNRGFLKEPVGLQEHPSSAPMLDTTRSKLPDTVPGETN